MMDGISGSRISPSWILHRKRRVAPRRNSFGCWRLLRRFWQIKIISGSSLPCASVFSMISMYSRRSFCTYLSSDGSTNRTMVMKIWGICSPDSRMAMAFFMASAFSCALPDSSASLISVELTLLS